YHHPLRARRDGHGRDRGADRAAHAPHQPPDRGPARAQARLSLTSRDADAQRPPPPLPELPHEERSRRLSRADPRARPEALGPAVAIAAGQPAPELTLRRSDGDPFTREQLLGATTVLVFYPFAFSPVCTDQLSVYNELLDDF